jgi:hypothetical protein
LPDKYTLSSLLLFLGFPAVIVGTTVIAGSTERVSENCEVQYPGVVAIVNGEVITDSDLDARCQLTIFSMGGAKNIPDDVKKKLRLVELKKMVDDIVKWQFITKLLKAAPINQALLDKTVDAEVVKMAKQLKMDLKQFTQLLITNNVDISVLKHKIKVSLLWQECLMAKLRNIIDNMRVSDKNAETILANQKKQLQQESYHMYRMFFPFSAGANRKEVYADANKVKQMLLNGVNFESISKEFRRKYNPQHWRPRLMRPDQLFGEELDTVKTLEVGNCVLLENTNGYIVLCLLDKKMAVCDDEMINFFNVVLPFDPALDQAAQTCLMNEMKDMINRSKNCHELMKKARESDIMVVTKPSSMLMSHFIPKYRPILKTIPVGGISEPVGDGNGSILVFCVLAKNACNIKQPTPETINASIADEKINMLANDELRHLQEISDIVYKGEYEQENLKKSGKI